mmetsp:Transcript_22835/g.91409  ORF Transcript_22835/g.91409 Transcript_22835/m.91409 type:complete len:888 (-) Transcript_22835:46-2709(-)
MNRPEGGGANNSDEELRVWGDQAGGIKSPSIGSPTASGLSRRASSFNQLESSAALGIRRMPHYFGSDLPQSPQYSNGPGAQSVPSFSPETSRGSSLMHNGSSGSHLARSSSPLVVTAFGQNGDSLASPQVESIMDRSASLGPSSKNPLLRLRRMSRRTFKFKSKKEIEKLIVFCLIILISASIFVLPTYLNYPTAFSSSNLSSTHEDLSHAQTVERVATPTPAPLQGKRNLTNLTAAEVLYLKGEERVDAELEPAVIAEVRRREWERARLEAISTKVSLVAACKDRTSMLHESLPTWQKALGDTDEIIIVDWSTSADMLRIHDFLKDVEDPRISSLKVERQSKWILSEAYNFAFQFATGELLLKVDCDTKLHPDFLKHHAVGERSNSFFRVNWSTTKDMNEQHLSGVFLMRKLHFDEVRGYDERIQSYGWDDSDLYMRIERLGVSAQDIDTKFLEHIHHEDVVRASDPEDLESPTFHIQLNSLLVQHVPPWSEAWPTGHAQYRCVLRTEDARYVDAEMTRPVAPLEEITSPEVYLEAEKLAYSRVLHDKYSIPWGILHEIRDPLPDVLSAFRHFSTASGANAKGAIFGEVVGTPAQRILALISMVALADKHDRILFLTWTTGEEAEEEVAADAGHMHLSSMFDWRKSGLVDALEEGKRVTSRLFPIGRLRCKPDPQSCSSSDAAWNAVSSGLNETEIALTLKGMHDGKKHILLHLDHTLKGLSQDELFSSYRRLVPSTTLMERVRKFGDTSKKLGVYVGMHMHPKQIVDFAKRLKKIAFRNANEFLVVGSQHGEVEDLRKELDISSWDDDVEHDTETHYERIVREVSELYALGQARTILNDGRCPAEVHELISILNSGKSSHEMNITSDSVRKTRNLTRIRNTNVRS